MSWMPRENQIFRSVRIYLAGVGLKCWGCSRNVQLEEDHQSLSAQASPGERQILMVNVVNYNQNSTKRILFATCLLLLFQFIMVFHRLHIVSGICLNQSFGMSLNCAQHRLWCHQIFKSVFDCYSSLEVKILFYSHKSDHLRQCVMLTSFTIYLNHQTSLEKT